ncbi:hypothetical protein [Glycomyces salinus]|uniref:hypothetical protein n=1 Tax=Glycomyces salinus TaxID=980294 RepID=UPI0018EDDF92|nr:hypothetical protein [Glycomyces salinus]
MLLRLASAAALMALAACGAGEPDAGNGGESPTDSDAGTGADEERVYEGLLTVIETPDHGPQLAGAIAQSYPPQGGGLDVTGWDWEAVEHESSQGTSWGDYVVTGTFDGEAFVLTEDPVPASEVDPSEYRDQDEPEVTEPAEPLSKADMEEISKDLTERFPETVFASRQDPELGVVYIDTVLVPVALEDYIAENYPEDTVVLSAMLRPVE